MNEEELNRLADIVRRLEDIEERNRRVSAEKGWETSTTRKVSILLTTYVAMCILFASLGNDQPLLNAIVPTLGFFLSTLSLPLVREQWKRRYKS